jgi:hypothetical protein
MSSRSTIRRRRDWRSGFGRTSILVIGWLSLLAAVGGLVAFPAIGRREVLVVAAVAATLAVLCSGTVPEPEPKRRRPRFAPLEGMRTSRRKPSLVRQLLTLP